jgi:hypothetical protein
VLGAVGSSTSQIENSVFKSRKNREVEQYKIAQDVQNLPAFDRAMVSVACFKLTTSAAHADYH